MSTQQPKAKSLTNAAAKENSLNNAGVLSDPEAISGCENTSTARQTGAKTRRLTRGPLDITFASGVSLALWIVVIFVLAVLF